MRVGLVARDRDEGGEKGPISPVTRVAAREGCRRGGDTKPEGRRTRMESAEEPGRAARAP